ncbi:AAA family ATPase [Tsukamurella ocularis]|uniref:AAA family ATPase n=1 Tax=Tsukamurella ocularis TaxID=1970234 RepID=UPI0039EF6745
MSILHLVIGSNGAGKSTFISRFLAPLHPGLPFVNADEIAKERWPNEAEARSYEAARIAEAQRTDLIASRTPFIAETVFSHPSKVEFVHTAVGSGFDVHLHIVMVPEDIAVNRVVTRVQAGGHSVPEAKIRDRYRRLWQLAAEAIPLTYTATCYDNSHSSGPRIVARFSSGQPAGSARWPAWSPAELTALWAARGGADA